MSERLSEKLCVRRSSFVVRHFCVAAFVFAGAVFALTFAGGGVWADG